MNKDSGIDNAPDCSIISRSIGRKLNEGAFEDIASEREREELENKKNCDHKSKEICV